MNPIGYSTVWDTHTIGLKTLLNDIKKKVYFLPRWLHRGTVTHTPVTHGALMQPINHRQWNQSLRSNVDLVTQPGEQRTEVWLPSEFTQQHDFGFCLTTWKANSDFTPFHIFMWCRWRNSRSIHLHFSHQVWHKMLSHLCVDHMSHPSHFIPSPDPEPINSIIVESIWTLLNPLLWYSHNSKHHRIETQKL